MSKPILLHETNYLSLFEIDNDGKPYYVASRDKNYDPNKQTVDAVTMFVISPDGRKILTTHEYRPAVNRKVISAPSGLIDPGETPEEAALRELAEETGYTDARVVNVFPATFSSVGMSNEMVQPIVIQLNSEENKGQRLGSDENITYKWLDKMQAQLTAISVPYVTARLQLALLLFAGGQIAGDFQEFDLTKDRLN